MKISISICLLIILSIISCSKSGRRVSNQEANNQNNSVTELAGSWKQKTIIKMEKTNGVYQIPIEINGVPMFFIFDTGASNISISETEAQFLYKHGKLNNEDIVGKENYSDANGNISEGTVIVLKVVKIGDKILKNVKASVVNNQNAPLLFGQSALERFGKISIDNEKNQIEFE